MRRSAVVFDRGNPAFIDSLERYREGLRFTCPSTNFYLLLLKLLSSIMMRYRLHLFIIFMMRYRERLPDMNIPKFIYFRNFRPWSFNETLPTRGGTVGGGCVSGEGRRYGEKNSVGRTLNTRDTSSLYSEKWTWINYSYNRNTPVRLVHANC